MPSEPGPPSVRVRSALAADAARLVTFRADLWPEGSVEEHRRELAAHFARMSRDPLAILVAEDAAGDLVGFCELSIRPCAEGCTTDRVAYLEGWYVVPEARRRGVGRALVEAAETWGRDQGCTELASDTGSDNTVSTRAHARLGFAEVGLVRCFRKELGRPSDPCGEGDLPARA